MPNWLAVSKHSVTGLPSVSPPPVTCLPTTRAHEGLLGPPYCFPSSLPPLSLSSWKHPNNISGARIKDCTYWKESSAKGKNSSRDIVKRLHSWWGKAMLPTYEVLYWTTYFSVPQLSCQALAKHSLILSYQVDLTWSLIICISPDSSLADFGRQSEVSLTGSTGACRMCGGGCLPTAAVIWYCAALCGISFTPWFNILVSSASTFPHEA